MGKTNATVAVRHKDVVRCLTQALCYYQLFANDLPGETYANDLKAKINDEDVELRFVGLKGDHDEVIEVTFRVWKPQGERVVVKLNEKGKFVAMNYLIS